MYDVSFRRQALRVTTIAFVACACATWLTAWPPAAAATLVALAAWLVSVWALARATGGLAAAWAVLLMQLIPVVGIPVAASLYWRSRAPR